MGTFGNILCTGQQALLAHQTALQVTGQNIANANTPGYSRECTELISVPSSSTRTMRSGVHVEGITCAYDRFITTQVAVVSSDLKGTQTKSDLLGQVETLWNDLHTPETGLSGALDALFQGLHDLAQPPRASPSVAASCSKVRTWQKRSISLPMGSRGCIKGAMRSWAMLSLM